VSQLEEDSETNGHSVHTKVRLFWRAIVFSYVVITSISFFFQGYFSSPGYFAGHHLILHSFSEFTTDVFFPS
jgi:uncharacterized membrane protein YvbJ